MRMDTQLHPVFQSVPIHTHSSCCFMHTKNLIKLKPCYNNQRSEVKSNLCLDYSFHFELIWILGRPSIILVNMCSQVGFQVRSPGEAFATDLTNKVLARSARRTCVMQPFMLYKIWVVSEGFSTDITSERLFSSVSP